MTLAIQTAIVMVVLLIIMLAMGVSISISVGLSSAVAMLCMLPAQVSFVTSAQRLFTGCKVGHVKIEQVIKELLPYFFAILVALLLVTYIPAISMTLPTLAGLIK